MYMVKRHELSSYQRDVWLEQCLYHGEPVYNLGGYAEFKGEIDKKILSQSLSEFVKNNDMFRMKITEENGEPLCEIFPNVAYQVPFYDFSSQENAYRFCHGWMKNEVIKPIGFDGPLFQFALLKPDEVTYIWFVKIHHIIIDGWGLSLMYRQVFERYKELMAGIGNTRKATYSYADFVDDNRNYMNSRVFENDREFWREKFRTMPEPLFNWNDGNHEVAGSPVISDRLTFTIERSLYDKIIACSDEKGCSVFHFMLAVLFTYFSRICNKDEIVIGVPVLNRGKAKYKQTIGLFTNVVPLRLDPGKDPSFSGLMLYIKRELMECYRHQKFPIGEICRTAFAHAKDRRNLFDISLSFMGRDFGENYTDYKIASLPHHHDRNPLTIFVREYGVEKDVYVDFDYRIGAFEKFVPIENVTSHFRYLLGEFVGNSEKRISEIEIIPEEEKNKILYDLNNTWAEYQRNKTIHELFEEQAVKTPDNMAVVFEDRQLSYGDLNSRANQLARVLRKKGVNPDSIVGIMADRCIEMVIGVLAVLKSGGAYLPIDPGYPSDRIKYMLEDSCTGILLTQKQLKDSCVHECESIDMEDTSIYEGDDDNPANVNSPNDLAYVIYTSGSTGKPKGVMIEHGGLANLTTFYRQTCQMSEQDKMLQFASYSFDASVWEMFTSLLSGSTLYMVSRDTIDNFIEFGNYINNNGITITLLPPTYLTGIDPEKITGLRWLITGGSAITKNLVDKWKDKAGYMNAYGPTEATVIATTWKYDSREYGNGAVPIGTPINNTEVYILDGHNKLLPIGAAGELCISGDGLARGYLNKPELTAEKFIPNPYKAGKRIYKTGDLARCLPDGTIEFLGRIDHQVKIRGFRIEPGEIESRFLLHEAVKEAVVTAREDSRGNKYLAAYVVTGSALATSELKGHLLGELPEYMVPSYIIRLDAMPLTPNGKIDVKSLPEPDGSMDVEVKYVAPRNETEATLVKLWKEVLETGTLGIRDNFFNLGGDSIKAIQMLSRLNGYNMKLKMSDLFRYPVIEDLSAYVELKARTIEQGVVEGNAGLTPIQHWLFEQAFEEKSHFNQAIMLHGKEGFEEGPLRRVLAKLAEHHDALRIVIKAGDGNIALHNRGLEGELYALETADLTSAAHYREAIEEAAGRIQKSMDLGKGPLLKAALFKTGDGDYLLIVIHHLVVDGVSWRIILQDLYHGYMQASRNEAVTFSPKTDSFKDWSDKLADYADSREILAEATYWAGIELLPVKPLPKDHHVIERRCKDNDFVRVALTAEETERLLKRSNTAYNTTIDDLLLTALGLTVREWAGTERIAINMEGHGREEIIKDMDISRTVGWFTAQYPVLLDLNGERDLGYRIKSTKESLRQIPGKGVGYGILKYLTSPNNRKALSFCAKPEISFNYLGQFDAEMDNGLFCVSDVPRGESVSTHMENPYAVDINALVANKKLTVTFTFNQQEYEKDTIAGIAGNFIKNLVAVNEHCAGVEVAERTPGDFTYKDLSIDDLETVLGGFDRQNVKDIYPLSSMQEGMLFHALADREPAAYFEQNVLSVHGCPDVNLLEESFNRLIERHDIFRTVFLYEKTARPLQIVMREQRARLRAENVACLPEDEANAFVAEFRVEDKRRGFDLKKDMPIRLSVIKTGVDSCKLIWSFHHIIMDGWCLGIVLKELLEIYASLREDRPPELGVVYPYSDYIRWLAEQDREEAASYWQKHLDGYAGQASLPGRNSAPAKEKYTLAEMTFRIDEDTKNRLEETARKNGVTLNTIVQGIWAIILQRYTNSDDVVFGAVVSGRPHDMAGVENMVGLFINTLPVRVKSDGNRVFAELLHEIQQAGLESERHGYFPLVEIQAATGLKGALIDHIVAFENYPVEEMMNVCSDRKSGFAIENIEAFEQTNYDLNLVVFPGKEWSIKFSYNSSVYERAFIEQLGEHIQSVMACVTVKPCVMLKDITMLTEPERRKILYDFNATRSAYPKDKTIRELFQEQAARMPGNTAVVCADRRLSYGELNEKANKLADLLRIKGTGANHIIGVMAERSLEMIVGFLGIMKAGGAYLPIDPAYPAERIAYMLEDSGAGILLTQKHLLDKSAFSGEVIDLDDQEVYRGDGANPVQVNAARDLAYVIYTSGSTGKPKGVMIRHASLVNLIYWHRRVYNITPEDRATQLAGPAFDASVWEIWPYLAAGAGIYIPDDETRLSPAVLIHWLKNNRITVSFMPTPLAEALLDEEWPDDMSLRALLTGGDQLRRRPSKDLPCALVNHYGPTENTVVATCAPVCSSDMDTALPAIGCPVDNTRIHILDRYGQLQPIGAQGELCISGDGLAAGYLNRPELTAEKFVSDPFVPGELMYRSGDLARWLPDGTIEFLGRIDHQVKIRGYRIELGEIESRLLIHEAVKEAVVIAGEDRQGDKYLSAYVVADSELTDSELKAHLLTDLPEYMVPSYFTRLDSMPLTPNGKIDRKSLPEPVVPDHADVSYAAPRNEIDARIREVWQEILGREMIGIDDNFFMIGGNSIKAIQVASRLALDFETGINDIYQWQTIRTLSDHAKYAKGRLREMMTVMQEAATARGNGVAFDGLLRSRLKNYKIKNRAYDRMDLSEAAEYQNILLAGSTGYLGVHILHQLLKNTGHKVHVLVRGKDDAEARNRLLAKLEFHFGLSGSDRKNLENRVCTVNGDLSKDNLGLSVDRYQELANNIDCIINSAANVKHYGHYSAFHDVNVKGNQRLVEFAKSGRKKAYNFVSTTSVGSGHIDGKTRFAFTEYDCDVGQNSDNYYVQTKLAAEKLLLQSRGEGLDVNIFRVGNLVFDSASGVFQENITDNAFYTLLKSLIKIGYFPEIHTKSLDFSFVDYVAKAIVLLFDRKKLQNQTHHLFNSNMVSMVSLAELLRQTDVRVLTSPVKEFIKYLHEQFEDEKSKDYITRILVHSNMVFEGASKTSFSILNQKTDSILRTLNFEWPELDSSKVKLMVEHSQQVGFV
jgi:amino acid adenylation domain-containing protein/thioester reductase-like protein/non-ribosomal peptide synthase protein (TIGR01720 family)